MAIIHVNTLAVRKRRQVNGNCIFAAQIRRVRILCRKSDPIHV
jgi:hypothetical protein